MGICLDGDGDRVVLVDANGRIVNGDQIVYIIASDRESRGVLHGGVVGTLMTNYGLEKALAEKGVPFLRAQVGDRYVLEQLRNRGWLYGGESSGHLICLDSHTTGDGIVAALQVLTALQRSGEPLSQWIQALKMYPQTMVNVPWVAGKNWAEHTGLVAAKKQVENMLGERGRVLIRASGTEPKLRLMVEAEDSSLVEQGIAMLTAIDLN
jgi:phosphoglucosamine mutase